jgi:hypothetical protein
MNTIITPRKLFTSHVVSISKSNLIPSLNNISFSHPKTIFLGGRNKLKINS